MNDRQADLAGRIRQRAGEIMQELDEMMLLSTIQESASETADRRHVEVCRILADVAGRFAEEARQRGLKLTVCADGQQFVPAWEDAIDTVCLHLLGNAVKYTPSGGQVTAVAGRRDGKVLLEITDTGIGIPDDQKGRIFSEFFRATNARQVAGGTGLGLSIVKAIVERLGGQIDFQTAQGVGTKVTVTLPPGEAPAPIPGGQQASASPGQALTGSA
jgi:signal transduction histidine kinase